MTDLFHDYPALPAWDEMLDDELEVRTSSGPVHEQLAGLSAAEVSSRADSLARSYLNQGVTFDFAGEERPFPLDVVPRVLDADEWTTISTGVSQRVRALEAFLDDVYGDQQVVADGVVPQKLILSSTEFQREAFGIRPPNGVRAHVSGIDLVRDVDGRFRVLEDNVRIPSGVSYVISNRRAMAQTFPELFSKLQIRPVIGYPRRLLTALIAAAPEGVPDPTVVVLTPGVYNSAYFEHTLLARLMGVELVEGRDLFVAQGRVWMRTTEGRRRVDVIYRRVDDAFLDPVQFRADSLLGVPGLMGVARLGNVTLANAVGNGVADDKLVYTYVPDLIRYYLGEQPIIANVDTWRLEEPDALEEVVDRLAELVVKPVDGAGGKGILVGPQASAHEIDAMRERLRRDPRGWIAQPVVQLSTSPTLIDDRFRPRHVDLRPFAVNDGENVWVLPGGLTRVALPEGQLVVNSSQGGGSKDTWVLGSPVHDHPAGGTHAGAEPVSDEELEAEAITEAEDAVAEAEDADVGHPSARPDLAVREVARQQHEPAADKHRSQPEQQQQQAGGPTC
ncbi:circularly permuted type 2 ATP-grasp protein [Luteimicrobium subarcticum]|uniref:Putative circularly permuted ATP-grasp superfamily protein n=1 Tax=Luteimicrobium subarcticum TaxID=620910 RepID=A0A2M8WR65_9MICO|nr:circularly permuted type 2 ATP-grasp protein [Luteimicrobium subarcticum]PJI93346.1 putative circularly permuted ATP-grasp superfamily protein [Luteimicrobium subarcticum]